MIMENPYLPWRVGLVVIENDPIPELEIRPEVDDGVSVVAARFKLDRSRGEVYLGEERCAGLPPAMHAALEQLDKIDVDAVGLCFTSSSIFAPATFDRLFVDSAQMINQRWVVTTAAQSIVDDLRAMACTRPLIVAPPWFSGETVDAVVDYLDHHGIGCAGHHWYQLGDEWAGIRRPDLFDSGAGWNIDRSALISQVVDQTPRTADAIVVPGSGFRSENARTNLQELTGLPVITANTAVRNALLKGKASRGRITAEEPRSSP